jgi:hypothetical protein
VVGNSGISGRSRETTMMEDCPERAAWLQEQMRLWPGVRVLQDRDRGLRFCTGRGEFLHFHGDRQVDIRLPEEDRDRAIASGLARFHPRSHEGGWVIVPLADADSTTVLILARLAYGRRLNRAGAES